MQKILLYPLNFNYETRKLLDISVIRYFANGVWEAKLNFQLTPSDLVWRN